MLVNFNPYTAETSILSIPRDTKVKFNGKKAKINSAYPRGGGDLAVETLSDLLEIDIEYYVFINTSAFRDIINTLDGVDYYVPINMDYDDPIQNLHIHIKKGQQHFDGVAAERFMRFRQGNSHKANAYYDGSDLKRIDAQQNFLKEVVRQKANIFYITKVSDILNVIFKNIDTDLSMKELLNMTKNLGKVNADQINMFKLPGVSENSDGWYNTMDEDEAFEIIDEHFSSKQP
jgi:LCP family protein required for cell wall assembly